MTARELPPFSEVTLSPAFHCGIGATRHCPVPVFTPDSSEAGIQAPMTSEAILPEAMPWYQASLQDETGARSLPSMSCCQAVAYFAVPASPAKFTPMLVPLTEYGLPPACQIMLVVKPASPVSL